MLTFQDIYDAYASGILNMRETVYRFMDMGLTYEQALECLSPLSRADLAWVEAEVAAHVEAEAR
jgi:hypothetical protein